MNGWVPLADRKPRRDGKYLVYAPCADADKPLIATAWFHAGAGWSLLPVYWSEAITHWMPLPEPPGRDVLR